MTYKCPNCYGALKYNAALDKMECEYCGSIFTMDEINQLYAHMEEKTSQYTDGQIKAQSQVNRENQNPDLNAANKNQDTIEKEKLNVNIYRCSSCGAELAVNGVESSSFCAYCGQPTVIFSRVEGMDKPDVVIPFSVTKEQAIGIMQQRVRKVLYIPAKLKKIDIERVRGIYVPFWTYDMRYEDDLIIRYKVKSGKTTVTKYARRAGETTFRDLTYDASRMLNDDSSQKLEPFYVKNSVPFDAKYLSGFYADRYDMAMNVIRGNAIQKACDLFVGEVMKTVPGSGHQVVSSDPKVDLLGNKYLLAPVWFMTVRYENIPYTLMVNGQTGKLVGGLPYVMWKVVVTMIVLFGVFTTFIPFIVSGILGALSDSDDAPGKLIGVIIVGAIFIIVAGINYFSKVKKSIDLTKEQAINRFSKERQDV